MVLKRHQRAVVAKFSCIESTVRNLLNTFVIFNDLLGP